MADVTEYQKLMTNPAFVELMEWVESRYTSAHLRADPPSTILPNYAEVTAHNAAQFRMVQEIKRFLAKKSKLR